MTRPALFVAVTGLLAALLAVAGALIARVQDESINVWLSLGTALVIATFLAFLILGPRAAKPDEPAAEGFAVVKHEEIKAQIVPRDTEGDAPVPSSAQAPEAESKPEKPGDGPSPRQP